MKFTKNDKIKVIDGFFSGSVGIIHDYWGRKYLWGMAGPRMYTVAWDDGSGGLVEESHLSKKAPKLAVIKGV